MMTLIVETGGRRTPFSFPGQAVSVGRADDNDLRIASRWVSQHHCRFEMLESGVTKVTDLDSQNGTQVNGEAISQRKLKPGDRVEIGSLVLWFQHAPEEEVTAPLDAGGEEATLAPEEDIQVSARIGAGVGARLRESLSDVFIEFRKNFGDERGLTEVEEAVIDSSRRIFPRPAFARSLELARLVDVVRAINSATDLNRVLAMIMDATIDMTDSERGFLVMREENGSWRARVARNFDQEPVKSAEKKFSYRIAEQVARTGQPICSVNAARDQRFQSFESVNEMRLRSVMCLPLKVRDNVVGTIYLDNRFKDGVYTEREISLLESFADHAAIALENARLYEQNLENERALASRTSELEEMEQVLQERMEEASRRNAAEPKVLSREGLRHDYGMIIGESPSMIELFRLLDRVISSGLPILITGESGTGKELVAQAIHVNSPRKDKPFVRENVAAIPESLLESELFGYKKGAFTGAVSDRKGLFEQADKGTIFLDEIGEMSLDMQSKLLRVLQNGEIRPVGARDVLIVDVRLISASNRDLRQMAKDKTFREDLFYRLNGVSVEVPPLRERMEDVPLLIDYFLHSAAEKAEEEQKTVDPLAMKYLLSYHWPGNVRELQNEMQRAIALSGGCITADDLSREITEGRRLSADSPSGNSGLRDLVKLATFQKEREIILRALEESDWRKSMTAKKLQISRPTLDQKIRQFGLAPFIEKGRQK